MNTKFERITKKLKSLEGSKPFTLAIEGCKLKYSPVNGWTGYIAGVGLTGCFFSRYRPAKKRPAKPIKKQIPKSLINWLETAEDSQKKQYIAKLVANGKFQLAFDSLNG